MRKAFLEKCINLHLCRIAWVLLLLIPAINSLQANPSQSKTVSGIVTSATDNEPLIGVSVQVKEAGTGAITDIDGKYSVNVQPGQTLIFSYIGYQSQEIKVSTSSTVNVSLKEDTEMLDEVVVVGYGVQKKKLVTGATVQVKGEELAKLNTNNPLQAMQGQTPGVNIISESGQPGSDMKVIIRGQGSNSSNGPLYVVDGIPGVDIKNISPSDIASIDVLKDAASAAIYGAQAANGVVLVTTKTGKEGKAQVSFDAYYGWQSAARKIELCNAEQYITLMDEQALNSGNSVYDWNKYSSIYDANGNVNNTDWMDEMFKDNATTQNYTLGVIGGSSTTTYAVSLGYYNQEGIVGGSKASNYERYNFRINLEQKLYKDFLKVGENVSFAYVKSAGIGTGNMYNNAFRGAYGTTPLQALYLQPDGRADLNNGYSYSTATDWYQYDGNPVASMYRNQKLSDSQTWNVNVYAEIQPVKNLKIKTQLGFNQGSSSYREYKPAYVSTTNDSQGDTTVSQSMYKGWTLIWTNTAAYDWTLGSHAFNVLIGMEAERNAGDNMSGNNKLLDIYAAWNTAYLNNAININAGELKGYPVDDYRRVSYFGRLGWTFNDRYMVNATLRSDGSSRFASGHRFGWFPSVSAGWVISEEKFMESTKSWMDLLKLRTSWGQVGNNSIGENRFRASVTLEGAGYNFGTGKGTELNSVGAYASSLGNDELKWETSEQTNIGLDARFLDNRLGLNFDWYYKTTKDWVVQAPVIATAGVNKDGWPYINGGDVTNKGFEVGLVWNDRIGKDFAYNIGGNLAYNKNEVGSIPTEGGILHGSTNIMFNNQSEFYRCSNGEPMGYFWGYRTDGLFQNQQEIDDWVAAGNGVLSSVAPGEAKFVDIDHNGVINDDDKVNLGNGIPKLNFGFNLGFTYKNFDFSTTWNGAAGFKVANGGYRNWGNSAQSNYTTYFLQRWTGEGTSNSVPRLSNTDSSWTNFSDLYLQDGDYLRIANVTLGYDFAKLINCKYISQARLYVQAQNLFTFTKYNGMDPEVGFGQDSWMSGLDTGSYPHARTFLVGVNLKF